MDYFEKHLDFIGRKTTEAPMIYHRWSIVAMAGALLGRQTWIQHGHANVYPNQYIMLMGSPGTRKGVAIGIIRRLMRRVGYSRFAAAKTSKERFLMDMKQTDDEFAAGSLADIEDFVLDAASESFILAGEFTDFIGQNNMEFVTMLTNLWDNLEDYENPKIHGKSVVVQKPTVNLFGANTVSGFALAFPPESIGTGFLSRVILVHSEPTGVQTTWPPEPDSVLETNLVQHLRDMREGITGPLILAKEARSVGDALYKEFLRHPIEDLRFAHYTTRRFTHLLKLSICIAALDHSPVVEDIHLIRANTMLAATERSMPKALGEFGKSKNSDVANKIMEYLEHSSQPRTATEIWKTVSTDVKISELSDILSGLQKADKIQPITAGGKTGYVPHRKIVDAWSSTLIDNTWLTPEEQT